MKVEDKIIIKAVTKIRIRNNELWMALLELAVSARPKKARAIIREITENDKRVSTWLSRL